MIWPNPLVSVFVLFCFLFLSFFSVIDPLNHPFFLQLFHSWLLLPWLLLILLVPQGYFFVGSGQPCTCFLPVSQHWHQQWTTRSSLPSHLTYSFWEPPWSLSHEVTTHLMMGPKSSSPVLRYHLNFRVYCWLFIFL